MLHPAYMPTKERLVQMTNRLRALDPNLERFQLEMRFNGSIDSTEDYEHFQHRGSMLHFEYAKSGEFTKNVCDESDTHLTTTPNATLVDGHAGGDEDLRYRYELCPGHLDRCYVVLLAGAMRAGIAVPGIAFPPNA
jgi:hypothetical protein